MISTHVIPVLNDNYAYVITTADGHCGVIDPGEARPVKRFLEENGLKPDIILLTHHHGDHVAGALDLKEAFGAKMVGPAAEADKIHGLDVGLHEGDPLKFGEVKVEIIETPGHTLGQINYFFPESKTLFSGDTLFVLGCGRVIEGSMSQMFESLRKLKALPPETQVYCGHEYTMANAKFAAHVSPDNSELINRIDTLQALRNEGKPTVPALLRDELATNPFLIAETPEGFSNLREAKDGF